MTAPTPAEIYFFAPFAGVGCPLDEVPDPAFAQRLVGDGMAVDPVENILHAPCDAVVQQIHPSRHAVTLMVGGDIELLVHIGVDTVAKPAEDATANVDIGDTTWQAAKAYMERLPGLSAVQSIAHNRLRLELNSIGAIDKENLSALGVQDVVVINDQVAHLNFCARDC